MYTKLLNDCPSFRANDGCEVQELLHPKHDPVDLPYSVAVCRVAVGGQTYQHYLRQTEVYLIMAGHGRAHIGTASVELRPGDAVVIPAEVPQWIENTGELELQFAAIVSPPWTAEGDVRL
jgi:mannose-6-phosphate isomerase-like protein (cupin superfamily)